MAALPQQPVRPAYAVFGDEEHSKGEAILAIRAKAIEDGDPAMCYAEFDGASASLRDVLDELRTLPFLSKRRVVLVENADKLVEAGKDHLNRFLESPPESGTLILSLAKLDARTRLAKTLLNWGAAVECKRLYENQVPGWIMQRVRARGKSMDTPTARLLAELAGTDLGMLAAHIEKLVTYVGDRPRITADDVEAMTITDRTRTVFELTECIGRRDARKALTVLGQFMQTDGEAIYIVTMLAWQLRRLWKTRRVLSEIRRTGRDAEQQVARAVGVKPFFARDLIRQASAFDEADLAGHHRRLLEADLKLKSMPDDPKTVLETLILTLCR